MILGSQHLWTCTTNHYNSDGSNQIRNYVRGGFARQATKNPHTQFFRNFFKIFWNFYF